MVQSGTGRGPDVVFLVIIFPKGVEDISVVGVWVHWLHTFHYRSYL